MTASGGATAITGYVHSLTVQQHPAQEPAPWPHQVGVIPPAARSFQHRAESQRLRARADGGGTTVLTQLLTGLGGVGKTQLAADFARSAWSDTRVCAAPGVDALVGVSTQTLLERADAGGRQFSLHVRDLVEYILASNAKQLARGAIPTPTTSGKTLGTVSAERSFDDPSPNAVVVFPFTCLERKALRPRDAIRVALSGASGADRTTRDETGGNTLRNLKIVSLAASAVLLGGGMTAVTAAAGSAAASDTPVSTARACTQNAPRFTSWPGTGVNDPAFWPARGTYATTTTRCKDINLKLDSRREVRTCFKRGTGWSCNDWRWLPANRWDEAATDVLDGTKFFLQFKGTARASGLIDY